MAYFAMILEVREAAGWNKPCASRWKKWLTSNRIVDEGALHGQPTGPSQLDYLKVQRTQNESSTQEK